MHGSDSIRTISWAEVHDLFVAISDEFGFTAEEYEDEITDLIDLWESQGFVEIYSSVDEREHGKAKDSSLVQGASPYYIGLFHVRLVEGQNDPLVVLVFNEVEGNTVASLRFMVDHDDMFGTKTEKFSPERMREIRKRIDSFIQQGNEP